MTKLNIREYTVGWICALPRPELAASALLLDEIHDKPAYNARVDSQFCFGRMGNHNVIVGCLPLGTMGTVPATMVSEDMNRVCPWLQFCLLVGIGGGVPSQGHDLQLGDVIISDPYAKYGGVVQYDTQAPTVSLAPPRALLRALNELKTMSPKQSQFARHLSRIYSSSDKQFHNVDRVLEAKSRTASSRQVPCACSSRCERLPKLHHGLILSGNMVIKDPYIRDRLSNAHAGAICFEMEAAGMVGTLPGLVIRGVCDFCDAAKNDHWQALAAASAASYAKEILRLV